MVSTYISYILSVESINVVIRDYLPFKPILTKTRANLGCSKRNSARMLGTQVMRESSKTFLNILQMLLSFDFFLAMFSFTI